MRGTQRSQHGPKQSNQAMKRAGINLNRESEMQGGGGCSLHALDAVPEVLHTGGTQKSVGSLSSDKEIVGYRGT